MTYLVFRRFARLGVPVVAGLAALTVLAACGSSGGNAAAGQTTTSPAAPSTTGTTGGASTDSMQAQLTKYRAAVTSYASVPTLSGGVSAFKGKNVWYIPIGNTVPILAAYGTGISSAMQAAGITVHVCDGKFVPTQVATCLTQALNQGADGVIAASIDYQMVPNAFDALVAKKIPTLIAGEANDSGKPDSSTLAFQAGQGALNLAQELQMSAVITDSGGKANILYLGVTDSPTLKDGATHGKQFLQTHCPGCTITEIDYNTASVSKVPGQVAAALAANPNTTYVVAESDASAPGAFQGIQQAGFTNKVKLTSGGGALDSLQRIAANQTQIVDAGSSPIYQGWVYADGLLRMFAGGLPNPTPPWVTRVFDSSNVGSLTLTPEKYMTNEWYGPDTYQDAFKTAWGVS
jgi:ribose transport system substrate-binding protein